MNWKIRVLIALAATAVAVVIGVSLTQTRGGGGTVVPAVVVPNGSDNGSASVVVWGEYPGGFKLGRAYDEDIEVVARASVEGISHTQALGTGLWVERLSGTAAAIHSFESRAYSVWSWGDIDDEGTELMSLADQQPLVASAVVCGDLLVIADVHGVVRALRVAGDSPTVTDAGGSWTDEIAVAEVWERKLPLLEPEPELLKNATLQKSVLEDEATAGMVYAMVERKERTLTVQSTGLASAVCDLETGEVTYIPGMGEVMRAVEGGDGLLYVACHKGIEAPGDAPSTVEFFVVDPSTMKVQGAADSGMRLPLNSVSAIPISDGAAFLMTKLDEDQPPGLDAGDGYVWTMRGLQTKRFGPIAAKYGDQLGPGRNDTGLLYGSQAENRVTRIDLVTGSISVDLEDLRAPEGTCVGAAWEW